MSSGARCARRRIGALAAVALLALLAASPAPALAQSAGSPLSPGLPQQPVTTTASAPTTTVGTVGTSGNDGLSGSGAIAIALGAVIVLSGISLFIWRDARRRAPVRHVARATAGEGGANRPGNKQRAKARKLSPAERRRRKRGRSR